MIISRSDKVERSSHRRLLEILADKRHLGVKEYIRSHVRYKWLLSLDDKRWYTISDLIELAVGNATKLGELCEFIQIRPSDGIYMEPSDIERQVKEIETEISAKSILPFFD